MLSKRLFARGVGIFSVGVLCGCAGVMSALETAKGLLTLPSSVCIAERLFYKKRLLSISFAMRFAYRFVLTGLFFKCVARQLYALLTMHSTF